MRRRIIVLLSAFLCAVIVCSQDASKVNWSTDFYRTTYTYWYGDNATTSNQDINHRQAKWYEFRDDDALYVGLDTFDDDTPWTYTLDNNVPLQHTHTYVDTIYMHKGSKTVLLLPTYKLNGSSNDLAVSHYQRWYDYRTDGSYHVAATTSATSNGTTNDLLVPGNAWYANNGKDEYSTNASTVSSEGAYRFRNGYVQIALTDPTSPNNLYQMAFYYPTDEEYATFPDTDTDSNGFVKTDNDYYAIACDMSIYDDTGASYKLGGRAFGVAYDESDDQLNTQGDFYEPTLVGRVIFFIIGVEDDEDQEPAGFEHYFSLFNDEAYQGGGNEEGTKYLEEFNITCPATRISTNTAECVTLTKDANAYAIPGGSSEDDHLTLTVAEGDDAVIKLQDTTLSGENRVIFYTANSVTSGSGTLSGGKDSGTWTIDDGSTATILVTKKVDDKTYNLARYNLTFSADATALKYSEVTGLSPGETNYKRSKEYFASDPTSIHHVDSLTFNRPSSGDASSVFEKTNHGSGTDSPVSGFYAFPMSWQRTSYAFYDGCAPGDIGEHVPKDTYGDYNIYCRYCYYSLVNSYCGWSEANSSVKAPAMKPGSSASTDETEGIADYWMYIDASDRPGTVAEIPFNTPLCENSELLATAWIKSANCESGSDDAAVLLTINGVTTNADGIEQHIPLYRQYSGQIHLDASDNQWYQIYFNFTIDETLANVDYDSYTLRIENSCASTNGGDFYFDEVHVYTIVPGVSVDQLDPVCTSDETYALTRVNLNYESLMLKLGYDTTEEFGDDDYAVVDICVVEEYIYNNYLSTHDLDEESVYEDAVDASAVNFVISRDETTGEDVMGKYLRYKFYLNYDKNTTYDTDNPGENLAYSSTDENHGTDFFYTRSNDTEAQLLSIDCASEKLPYTPYVIIIKPHEMAADEPDVDAKYFAYSVDDACSTTTVFFLSSFVKMYVNGEQYDPDMDICIGTTVELTAQGVVTVIGDDEGEEDDTEEISVSFDWFVGTAQEYTESVYGTNNSFSVNDAIQAFREEYPTNEDLTDVETTETFTSEMLELLQDLLNEGRLYLYTTTISSVMPAEGITVVATPTPIDVTGEYEAFCVGYVPVVILASGEAPTLLPGFADVAYPYDTFVPSVRAGLAQLTRATTNNDNNDSNDAIPLTINLRKASYVTDNTDHLGRATTDGYDKLYLVSTTDPQYPSTNDIFAYPMGEINALYGNVDDTQSDDDDISGSYVKVTFYGDDDETSAHKAFTPREGYEYTFYVYFDEYTEEDGVIESNACMGNFQLTIKVVPEYVVWNSDNDADTNWNTDAAWRRADNNDLHYSADDYTSNEANTTNNAYVPMLFTNAVMPKGTSVALYPAGYAFDSDDNLYHWLDESTIAGDEIPLDPPTNHIMYDMMVYGGELNNFTSLTSLTTQRYRTNLCNELHLAQNAQMLHSEILLTDKVWTDVAIPQNTWTLVASPLTGIVAGDWYTDTSTGTQATLPLFTDITFSDDVNDRYNPAVYQRSWQKAGTIIANSSDDNRSVPAYETTGWTSAYNDAYVSYQPGEGYSIKGGYGDTNNTADLVFRFPKADEEYTYGSGENNTTTHDQGQLAIFSMVDRSSADADYSGYSSGKTTVTLSQRSSESSESSTQYYIIGNPFTAYMSMSKFMSENKQFDAYWLPDDGSTGGPVAGNSSGNSSWQTNSEGSDNVYVKPYSAFFVRVDDNYTGTGDKYTVTFTPEMQTMTIADEPTLLQFSIRASSAQGTSSASIAYSDNAANDYALGEDVLLLTDNSWNHSQPMVYSVAGSNAVAVNMVADLYQIPLGVFATDDSDYTLTFVGVDKLDTPSLYDADELTDTPLTEGYTLTLNGSTHGRYFLRAQGAPEGISDIAADDDNVNIYCPTPHTLVITATSEIMSIEVYSLNGTALAKATPASLSCTLSGLPTGVALVRTTTDNSTTTKKLYIR